MGDEEFQRMRGIALLHLLLFFPSRARLRLETPMAIVVRRGGILHPQVARGDLPIRQARGFFDCRRVALSAPEGKNSRRRTKISLAFGGAPGRHGMETKAPSQPVFPKPPAPWPGGLHPGAVFFFKDPHLHLRGIPIRSQAKNALTAICGQLECSRQRG